MNHGILAQIAAQAYDNATLSIHECEAFIVNVDGYQVVAFRGTEAGSLFEGAGWLDVVRDARVLPWYDRDAGWAHSGFLKGGRLAAERVAPLLRKDSRVVCTGHSLGGALGLICAVKLQSLGFRVVEWVGFGSPKVQLSCKHYNFAQTNYRHAADIVPTLPHLPFYRHNCPVFRLAPDDELPNWRDHAVGYYQRHT